MSDIIFASSGTLEQIEKQVIEMRFAQLRGNKSQTAVSLGISVRTLETRLEQYKNEGAIQDERKRQLDKEREEQLTRMRGPFANPTLPGKSFEQLAQEARDAERIRDEKRERANYEVERRSRERAAIESGHVSGPTAGMRLESAPKVSGQQSVPMPERPQVQEVLQRQTASSGKSGRR